MTRSVWLRGVLGIAIVVSSLSLPGCSRPLTQAAIDEYNTGYDDGYYDAENDYYFWRDVDPTPDRWSEFYWYDTGYKDGFLAFFFEPKSGQAVSSSGRTGRG